MSNQKPFTETMKFNRWRTSMGYLYMAVCAFDFIGFPILNGIMQYYAGATPVTHWDPITLHGAGLFHMAMGAILGVAAWSKSQEVINSHKMGVRDEEDEITEPKVNKYKGRKRTRRQKDELL